MPTGTIIISSCPESVEFRKSGLGKNELSTMLDDAPARFQRPGSTLAIILHHDGWTLPSGAENTAFKVLRGTLPSLSIASMNAGTEHSSFDDKWLDTNNGKLSFLGMAHADKRSNEHAKGLCEPHSKNTWHSIWMRLPSSEITMQINSGSSGRVKRPTQSAGRGVANMVPSLSTPEGGDPKFSSSAGGSSKEYVLAWRRQVNGW